LFDFDDISGNLKSQLCGELMKKLGLLALSLIASVQATDYQYVGDPVTGYNSLGVPNGMTNINASLPADLLTY
jgi:hypothetical protein